MLSQNEISHQFSQQGYVILPQLFPPEKIAYLVQICERIRQHWRNQFQQRRQNKKTLSLFKYLEYFDDSPEQLEALLNLISESKITSILDFICEQQLFFNGIVYFFNPQSASWQGDWHRDGQIAAPNLEIEKSRVFSSSFIRILL
ncbi:MAG: hypothetical protein AAFQ80_03785 [Cyanobacteria bacterium J06621_8]